MNSKIHILSLPILVGTIVGVFIGGLTNDVKIGGIASFVISSIILFCDIYIENWEVWQNKLKSKLAIFLLVLSIFVCISFNQINHFINPIDLRSLPIIFFGLGFILPHLLLFKNLKKLKFDIKLSFSLVVFYGFAVGHTFAGYYLRDIATYSLMFSGGIFTSLTNEEISKRISKYKEKILKFLYFISLFISFLAFISIFRKDFLDWASSSLFHWFYFVGPVSEYQAGAGYETFNQYSQGALMLASNLSASPWYSVYIFQIIIYLITFIGLFFISLKKQISTRLFISALCFLLMFSDPWTVGPQAYPSSGLLRFFPLVVWGSFIFIDSNNINGHLVNKSIKDLIKKCSLFVAILTSILWSGEMAICFFVATPVVFFHQKILNNFKEILTFNNNQILKFNEKNKIYKLVFSLIGFIFLILLIFKLNLIQFEFLSQIIAYPFSYLNKGYGWYQPQAWITLSPLFALLSICSIALVSDMKIIKKIGFLACCGLVFGYVSYRPVSNNITAALPTSLILISSFLGSKYSIKLPDSNKKITDFASIANYLKGLVITIAFISALLQLTHVKNIKKIISISFDNSRGEFYKENGGMDILNGANCNKGDLMISKLIKDEMMMNNIRAGKLGITYIGSKFNYLIELGDCYEFNDKSYHPNIFQPAQLYDAPIDKVKSKLAVKKSLQNRKFHQILFLSSTEDKNSERLRNYFFELLPDDWEFVKTYNLNKKLTGYLWEKERR